MKNIRALGPACFAVGAFSLTSLAATRASAPSAPGSNDSGLRLFNLDLLAQSAQLAIQRAEARARRIEEVLGEAIVLRVEAKSFDVDRNGRIDPKEYLAFERAVFAVEKNPRVLQHFDDDRAGRSDRAEWIAARKALMPI